MVTEVQTQIRNRFEKEKVLQSTTDNQQKLDSSKIIFISDPPHRTDQEEQCRDQKYVYVISNSNYPGEFKVGVAKDVKMQLNSFQTSDPKRQFQLRHSLKTPWYQEIETHIHKKFPNKHEWVSGKLENIVSEIENFQPSHHCGGNLFPDLRPVQWSEFDTNQCKLFTDLVSIRLYLKRVLGLFRYFTGNIQVISAFINGISQRKV